MTGRYEQPVGDPAWLQAKAPVNHLIFYKRSTGRACSRAGARAIVSTHTFARRMKIYRPLVVLLLAFICGLTVSAQDSSELTSLRAKAVKGNGIAQYNLGLAYAEGHRVAADPI